LLFVVAKRDFTDSDCVFVALLSHGDEGVIYGTDGPVQYEQIFSLFKPPEVNKSLVGKPKIFLIQVRSEFIAVNSLPDQTILGYYLYWKAGQIV